MTVVDWLLDAGLEHDERMIEAIEILESKRDPGGRWPVESGFRASTTSRWTMPWAGRAAGTRSWR